MRSGNLNDAYANASQSVSQLCRYSSNHSALHPYHSHISSLLLFSLVLSSHTSHLSHCNVMRLKEKEIKPMLQLSFLNAY